MKTYAGIGSRSTPPAVLETMQKLGRVFTRHGWVLRSGNCKGADQAFQTGANLVAPAMVELFLPWQGYEPQSIAPGNVVHTPCALAYELAARYHPAWKKCIPGARAMHARNVQIVLGADLCRPVELILCWTPGGRVVGGTAMAMRLAAANGIALKNLALVSSAVVLREVLGENEFVGWDCSSQNEFSW